MGYRVVTPASNQRLNKTQTFCAKCVFKVMKEEKIKNQNPWEENKHSIIVFPLWKIRTKDKLKEFMMKQKQGMD